MKRRIRKQKYTPALAEKVENFLHSDNIPATATKFVLMGLAVGGVAFGGAVIPGVLKILAEFNKLNGKEKKYDKKEIGSAIQNLKRQKLVEIMADYEGKTKIKLTNKGKERLVEFSFDTLEIKKPKKWDGKWRIVIFDIPERFKLAREVLREKIRELGLCQLQKSVWIHPFECEDEILFIAEAFEVEKYVEIITAEKLSHGNIIKKLFSGADDLKI